MLISPIQNQTFTSNIIFDINNKSLFNFVSDNCLPALSSLQKNGNQDEIIIHNLDTSNGFKKEAKLFMTFVNKDGSKSTPRLIEEEMMKEPVSIREKQLQHIAEKTYRDSFEQLPDEIKKIIQMSFKTFDDFNNAIINTYKSFLSTSK